MNRAGWPREVEAVFERSVTAEFATLTRAGAPITVPTTPYLGSSGETVDVSTGLTYPAKAERARQDPRVCLLFADPIGAGSEDLAVVMVQGLATVRDGDLQANTDRYVRASTEKLPDATKGQPRAVLRRMVWYYARIWVEITPLHMRWWPSRRLDGPPQQWDAPEGTAAPLSDPAPPGKRPGAWVAPAADWRALTTRALGQLALHDLTVVDANGFPLCLPVGEAEPTDDGVRLRLGPGAPAVGEGVACLTMHGHGVRFTGQENHTVVGTVAPDPDDGGWLRLRVQRALGDWSLAGNRALMAVGFLSKGRRLARRVEVEATRRGQPVPTVRFPGEA
ncbi:MAG TPA: pyridoxamine 5'-phosphate oxidase family protein [Acidimicrobiales bacterium]|nr:pyridoxamine 5'-phosphate oxidase family protein [Acidimicrobiales bacterium]